jgi:hypothetical protein
MASPQAQYKKGPHIHVGSFVSRDPFPHAHIALGLNYLESVLESDESLFAAMDAAINMIVDEVLTLYMK